MQLKNKLLYHFKVFLICQGAAQPKGWNKLISSASFKFLKFFAVQGLWPCVLKAITSKMGFINAHMTKGY